MHQRIRKLLSTRAPAVLWTCTVLLLMAIPGDMLPKEEKTFIPNLDKLVHATLFGGFVFLWSIYYATRKDNHINSRNRFVWIVIIACLYGVATELMQKYFIPHRDYDTLDMVADSTGAIIGFIFFRITVGWFKRPDF